MRNYLQIIGFLLLLTAPFFGRSQALRSVSLGQKIENCAKIEGQSADNFSFNSPFEKEETETESKLPETDSKKNDGSAIFSTDIFPVLNYYKHHLLSANPDLKESDFTPQNYLILLSVFII